MKWKSCKKVMPNAILMTHRTCGLDSSFFSSFTHVIYTWSNLRVDITLIEVMIGKGGTLNFEDKPHRWVYDNRYGMRICKSWPQNPSSILGLYFDQSSIHCWVSTFLVSVGIGLEHIQEFAVIVMHIFMRHLRLALLLVIISIIRILVLV